MDTAVANSWVVQAVGTARAKAWREGLFTFHKWYGSTKGAIAQRGRARVVGEQTAGSQRPSGRTCRSGIGFDFISDLTGTHCC